MTIDKCPMSDFHYEYGYTCVVNISQLYLHVCGSLLADRMLNSTQVEEFMKSFYDALHPRVYSPKKLNGGIFLACKF